MQTKCHVMLPCLHTAIAVRGFGPRKICPESKKICLTGNPVGEPRYETGMDYRTRVWNGNDPELMAELPFAASAIRRCTSCESKSSRVKLRGERCGPGSAAFPMKRVWGGTDRREVVHERKRPRTLQTRWTTNLEHVHSEWLRPLEKTASLLGGRRRWRCKRWLRSATRAKRFRRTRSSKATKI
jgi:hypothetical protein